MRIVLDTAVLVRATAKASGPARLLLEQIAAGGHQLILSPFLLEETERVLNYPRIQGLYRLSPVEVQEHIDCLQAAAEIVEPVVARPIVKDPHDDPVLFTAVAGGADVLCTLDRDFHDTAVLDFCRALGIAVMNDAELLRLLRWPGSRPGASFDPQTQL
jgi:putative PIN family toxin of toxin-antitoxin system